MNLLSEVYKNPLILEGNYWVRLTEIDYLTQKPADVSEGWVATLVIERVHPEQQGTTLKVAVHGTQNATGFRHSFRDHFRCFDYAPQLAVGRWARVGVVHAEFNSSRFSQVLCPQLRTPDLTRMVHRAVEFERQSGSFKHQPRSLSLLGLHRETLVLTDTEQPPTLSA